MRGYMGLGPEAAHTQASGVRQVPDIRWLARVRSSGTCRTSGRCSFGQLLLLVLVLGVLAVLSMVFLLVPGHA